MAAMGHATLLPLEVWLRPEHARDRVSEPFFCSWASRHVWCRSPSGGMEAAFCPRRSPRRSDTGRSRQTAALSAASPCGHALADLARPVVDLSRAWPDRVADDLDYRAISGHANAPPSSAGRDCRGARHRRRVPSSFGLARCYLLALCLRYRTPGGLPLRCRLRGWAGFLLRAIAFDLSRPHKPPRRPL